LKTTETKEIDQKYSTKALFDFDLFQKLSRLIQILPKQCTKQYQMQKSIRNNDNQRRFNNNVQRVDNSQNSNIHRPRHTQNNNERRQLTNDYNHPRNQRPSDPNHQSMNNRSDPNHQSMNNRYRQYPQFSPYSPHSLQQQQQQQHFNNSSYRLMNVGPRFLNS